MNIVIVSGFLMKDPEVKKSKSGLDYCNFSINNATGFGDKKNNNFFSCTCFGKTATTLGAYKHKGDFIFVIGEINIQNYEDAEGNKKIKVQITANSLDFPPLAKVTSSSFERPYDQSVKGNYKGMVNDIVKSTGYVVDGVYGDSKPNPFDNIPSSDDISGDDLGF